MADFKQIIGQAIAKVTNLNEEELESYIEKPKDQKNGDYAFPCFKLAKELRKAPAIIANDIQEKIEIDKEKIEKVETDENDKPTQDIVIESISIDNNGYKAGKVEKIK